MATLTEITKRIKKRNDELDGITDNLVKELTDYQIEYERQLRKAKFDLDSSGNLRRNSKNFSKATSMKPMQKLGFNELSVAYIDQYPQTIKDQLLFNKRMGLEVNIDFKDVTMLKHLQNVDLGEMMLKGQELDAIIKRELVNAIALEAPYQDAVDNIAMAQLGAGDKLGRIANFADSQMRTSLYGLTRTVDRQIYEDIGEEEFIYTGALDKRTRPFCKARVGKRFDIEEINNFGSQNGSGLDGFFSPGGFRCRHSLIGVSALD